MNTEQMLESAKGAMAYAETAEISLTAKAHIKGLAQTLQAALSSQGQGNLLSPKSVPDETVKRMVDAFLQQTDRVRELEKDAERYRWILSNATATDALWKFGIPSKIALTEKHISNAIDEAMKGE